MRAPKAGASPKRKADLQPAEKAIIDALEIDFGRPLTRQEIYLSLEQAREVGNL
jgi:hypothetical protein